MSRSMNRIENINNTISVKQDDTGTVVQLKIYDYDGNPVDLKNPDIDKIEVKIGAIGRGFHTIKIPTLLDETGALEFRLDVDDKVPAGTNDVEVHVYYKNGRKRIFPAESAYKFKVSKSLDAVGKEVFKVTVDYLLEQFDNKKKEIEDEAAALREEIENAIQYVDESITEVRQEFNEQLDQTVDNKMTPFVEVVNKHLAEDVTQQEGVHGFRVIYGKGQYYDKIEGKWKDVEAIPGEKKIYGLEWNQTLDTYQRLDDAVGMVAITQGQNDFDSFYPWSEMKRCNLDDNGNVLAYFGDPTYKDDGSNGQVMVQIPKFWYKSEMVNEGVNKIYRWWIADNEVEGFKLHPAFVRNGVEKDYIYIGAYEGYVSGGMLHSRAGVVPTASRTIVQFRNDAQARGSIWHQQDFLTICAIQLLYLIEYAHFDSQTKIGKGITEDSVYHQTGETTQYGNQSFGDPNNATVAMSYRGIENLYGNYWKWVDGININNHRAYIADNNFESDKFDGHYRQVGFTNDTSNGYVKDIGWTPQDNFMFLAINSYGSNSSYLHDYYFQNIGARVALFGGFRSTGLGAGAFSWYLSVASSGLDLAFGARLLCVP